MLLVSIFVLIAATFVAPCLSCTERIYVIAARTPLAISNDGGNTWTRLAIPTTTADQAVVTSVYAENANIYVGTMDGLAMSRDNGLSWNYLRMGSGKSQILSLYGIGDKVFAGLADARVWISNNKGVGWVSVNMSRPEADVETGYSIYYNKNRIFVGTSSGLAIGTEDGKTWTYLGKNQGMVDDFVSTVAGFGENVYAGSIGTGDKISGSSDNGQTWTLRSTGAVRLSSTESISTIDGKTVYAATFNDGLFISRDSGKTWTKTPTSNGSPKTTATQVAAVGNGIYVADLNGGISISRDGGKTWVLKDNGNSGLPGMKSPKLFGQCV